MKKIMVVGPNIGLGGVERASVNLSNEISRLGYKVFFVALIPKEPFYALDGRVEYFEPKGFNQSGISLIKTLVFLRKHINRINPDAIIGFTKFYGLFANLSLIATPHRIFISERSSPLYKWPRHISLFCSISKLLRKPAGIIAQTKIAASYQQLYYGNIPISVIPNAIRKLELYPNIERQKILLCVGRMGDSCKGFDLMIESFSRLKNQDWELHFAGGTEDEGNYLIENLSSEHIRKRIKFLGRVKDIDLVYASAGIFVLPSRSEGFPNALSEAMAAGVPCISFDFIAGPGDLITHNEDGILVPREDVTALAETIDQLINDPLKRKNLGENAMESSQRFKGSKIAKLHIDFISNTETN